MSPHDKIVDIDGVKVMLDKAWAGPSVRAALRSGSYERAERRVLAATLSPDDTYFELGSGIGVLATQAAGRVGDENVVAVEADPAIAAVARETASRNGHVIDIRNIVLLHDPVEPTTPFYVFPDFRLSSLSPPPEGGGATNCLPNFQMIKVPTADAFGAIASVGTSYLMVDIEGGEIDLLRRPLPDCVETVCVELHTQAASIGVQSEMIVALLTNGFDLDIGRSDLPVLLFTRRRSS